MWVDEGWVLGCEASMILGFGRIGEPARACALGSVAVCVCGNTDVKEYDRCVEV